LIEVIQGSLVSAINSKLDKIKPSGIPNPSENFDKHVTVSDCVPESWLQGYFTLLRKAMHPDSPIHFMDDIITPKSKAKHLLNIVSLHPMRYFTNYIGPAHDLDAFIDDAEDNREGPFGGDDWPRRTYLEGGGNRLGCPRFPSVADSAPKYSRLFDRHMKHSHGVVLCSAE
jgi:hypothetical protein